MRRREREACQQPERGQHVKHDCDDRHDNDQLLKFLRHRHKLGNRPDEQPHERDDDNELDHGVVPLPGAGGFAGAAGGLGWFVNVPPIPPEPGAPAPATGGGGGSTLSSVMFAWSSSSIAFFSTGESFGTNASASFVAYFRLNVGDGIVSISTSVASPTSSERSSSS